MRLPALALVVLVLAAVPACATTPVARTWEWYRAAETQLRYEPAEPRLAAKYFWLAAEAGNDAAQYKLGEHYLGGIGVPADPVRACDWFRRSAEAGNPHAAVKLGECFQKGVGMVRDPQAALHWYEAAIARNNAWGHHMLGFMLADGDGVPRNEKRARECLEISVRANDDPWAKWRLARLIRETEPDRARRLFEAAAAAGNIEAWLELD